MDHLLSYQPDTGPTIVRAHGVVQCAVRCRSAVAAFDYQVKADRLASDGAAVHPSLRARVRARDTANREDSAMPLQPYLFFNGRCEEAIGFYQRALDAQVEMLLRFKDNPDPPPPGAVASGHEDKVMHASLRIGDSVLMMSDGCADGAARFDGFALSIAPADEEQARRQFDALADGGQVRMPLGETFWSRCFGMAVDRFGVCWMLNVMPENDRSTAGGSRA